MNPSELRSEAELLESFANEKKLIGFDLHDGAIQLLVGSLLQLESIVLNKLDEKAAKKISESKSLLSKAIEQMRQTIHDLAASTIETGSLSEEIKTLIDSFQSDKFQVDFLFGQGLDEVQPLLGGSLYHMVKEAIHNVIKHAQASRAIANLSVQDQVCLLVIADDGQGITAEVNSQNRFGLVGIRSRAQIFGGEFHLYSSRIDRRQFIRQQQELAERIGNWRGGPFESGTLLVVEIPRKASS